MGLFEIRTLDTDLIHNYTDPRPGIIGKTISTLIYRVLADKSEYFKKVQLRLLKISSDPFQQLILLFLRDMEIQICLMRLIRN